MNRPIVLYTGMRKFYVLLILLFITSHVYGSSETTGPEYESLAATGGEAVDDLVGSMPGIGWDRLTRTFLERGERKILEPF